MVRFVKKTHNSRRATGLLDGLFTSQLVTITPRIRSIDALGTLPLAIAGGAGNEILQPLAIVVLGGLFTSTALTLLVIPALYAKFGKYLIPNQKPADHETSFPLNPDLSVNSVLPEID
ncbi:hypothetical protein ANSO36C_65990 (plasmid) [Nostoc cf. commune SO-36]|uniref:Cation transporter n=1 Tax=Nostoc cf. commune SO-36 TaxID=449208 RepID=A0ABN6QH81_NOSCO|nr:hypothetical protein ANSO36C_65990 [Nostoc cf. commune SO-36]